MVNSDIISYLKVEVWSQDEPDNCAGGGQESEVSMSYFPLGFEGQTLLSQAPLT